MKIKPDAMQEAAGESGKNLFFLEGGEKRSDFN